MRWPLALTAIALLLPGSALARTAWVDRAVDAHRWHDSPQVALTLLAGTEVQVVYEEGDMVRIRRDDRLGWVPADALRYQEEGQVEEPAEGEPDGAEPSGDQDDEDAG